MNSTLVDAVRLLEIMGVNILLSGDNSVAVGMAIRYLPRRQQRIASAAGIAAATLLQIGATLTLAGMLTLPAVSFFVGLVLCAIAIRLTRNNGGAPQTAPAAARGQGLWGSAITVAGAYFVMCLDNIVGIAAVGRGHPVLLVLGLLLSIVVIIPASLVIAKLMRSYPLILTAGAGILGWVAGSMIAAAMSRLGHVSISPAWKFVVPAAITLMVITSPLWLRPGIAHSE